MMSFGDKPRMAEANVVERRKFENVESVPLHLKKETNEKASFALRRER